MLINYEPEFKEKIVRLHLSEGRTIKSLHEEYGVSESAISRWCLIYRTECREISLKNPDIINEADLMDENRRLRKELEEQRKENAFLKKAAAFFAKEVG